MGIVNRTPDSFFDGGTCLGDDAARARVEELVAAGADWVDVGAESTRPGAPAISARVQLERLGDTIAFAASLGVRVSIDTTSTEVAERACADGATMINSVALAPAAALARVAHRHGADLVLTHCRGSMTEMRGFSSYAEAAYGDVVSEVADEWLAAAQAAEGAGLDGARIVCDPGLGFTKNAHQSLELCARLGEIKERVGGRRVLVGPSRKSYLAHITSELLGGEPPPARERLGGSIAAALDCAARGADILRVHDVVAVRQALAYATAVSAYAESTATGRRGPPTSLVSRAGGDRV
jgi:dihydropteroate synthase